jgi:DNA-binding LytR/AlgR family response regulator
MQMNCTIIEDEPLAQERIRDYLQKIPFLHLLATFDNCGDAMVFLRSNTVDLIFLDINMGDFSGIQLLEGMAISSQVIITTAYHEYALKGFELNVTDYLLKPYTFERFLQAVDRAQNNLSGGGRGDRGGMAGGGGRGTLGIGGGGRSVGPGGGGLGAGREDGRQDGGWGTVGSGSGGVEGGGRGEMGGFGDRKFIFVKTEYRLEKVLLHDVLYIEGVRDYRRIHVGAKQIMTLQTFGEFEVAIPAAVICRVHKSYMVSVDKIDSIERDEIRIRDRIIPISETYKKRFFEIIRWEG